MVANWWELNNFKGEEICVDEGMNRVVNMAKDKYGLDLFDGMIFIFPTQDECDWGGAASLGGNPSYAFINYFDLRPTVHEIGHNFGINHANLLQCDSNGCKNKEYWDESDAMGGGPLGMTMANMNSPHLRGLNLKSNNDVKTFTTDGIYTLYKVSSNKYPQIIKLPSPLSLSDTYIEYRGGRFNYDTDVLYPLAKGVLIYSWNGNPRSKTKLIDRTPNDDNLYNLVLLDGKSMVRPFATVKQISHTENYVKLQITKN